MPGLLPTDAELISLIASTWPSATKYELPGRGFSTRSTHDLPIDPRQGSVPPLRLRFSICDNEASVTFPRQRNDITIAKRAHVSSQISIRSRRSNTFSVFTWTWLSPKRNQKSKWQWTERISGILTDGRFMANERAFHWKANRSANDLEAINAARLRTRYKEEEKKTRGTKGEGVEKKKKTVKCHCSLITRSN